MRFTWWKLRQTTPDHWFLLGFITLMLAFLLVFALEPSGVGRGGR